ncbi:MAG: hypothetical protein IJN46_07720, partial [Lachnospiraceae bacterium]|nr:hypothetical protein [Lachnospiraceae bacterium]
QPEMSNIIRLCEILEASPNVLFGLEEPKAPASGVVSADTENDSLTKETNSNRKTVMIALSVCCILFGMLLGFLVKSISLREEHQPDIPIEFSVDGYDLRSEANADGVKTFRLNFTSNVSNLKYDYKIIVTDRKGTSREFDVRAGADGVYTGTFQAAEGAHSHYLISVSVNVGENIYTDSLIKISNISEIGYSWEKLND